MARFRSESVRLQYEEERRINASNPTCVICDREALQSFTYWKIITNEFPYDLIASTHHMLVPMRHVTEVELSDSEKEELVSIKHGLLDPQYDFIIETVSKKKSIPEHFHLHLVVVNPLLESSESNPNT
jgi:hypothetical protein